MTLPPRFFNSGSALTCFGIFAEDGLLLLGIIIASGRTFGFDVPHSIHDGGPSAVLIFFDFHLGSRRSDLGHTIPSYELLISLLSND